MSSPAPDNKYSALSAFSLNLAWQGSKLCARTQDGAVFVYILGNIPLRASLKNFENQQGARRRVAYSVVFYYVKICSLSQIGWLMLPIETPKTVFIYRLTKMIINISYISNFQSVLQQASSLMSQGDDSLLSTIQVSQYQKQQSKQYLMSSKADCWFIYHYRLRLKQPQ